MLKNPDQEALRYSQQLSAQIKAEIIKQNGMISFADYMQHALYAPGLGYYAAGAAKFGAAGDFVTASEISSLFGATLAGQILSALEQAQINTVLELGAGTGRLAFDILNSLSEQNKLPAEYLILEPNADCRDRQQQLLNGYSCVKWINALPESFSAVIIANEVWDALPIYCFEQTEQGIMERAVGLDQNNEFIWKTRPFQNRSMLDEIAAFEFPIGYCSELHPHAEGLITSIAQSLEKGVVIIIDYGFEDDEYYHPARHQGTLRCHYRHQMTENPFLFPGLQDITADVNYTGLLNTALANNLEPIGFTTQSSFLLHAGIIQLAEKIAIENQTIQMKQAIQMLTQPHEMGSLFKVAGFSKNIEIELSGFSQFLR